MRRTAEGGGLQAPSAGIPPADAGGTLAGSAHPTKAATACSSKPLRKSDPISLY
jgi:hypothetical protein